jgi:hypothetical protein
MRWKLYWAGLAGTFLAAAGWHNWKKYPERSKAWLAYKSAADVGLASGLAWLFPPLLIAFSVGWILQRTRRDTVIQTIVGVVSSVSLAALSAWAMELFILVGIVSIDQVTGRLVREAEASEREELEMAA